MSFLWGAEVIIREQYAENMSRLWTDYPNHPMTFLHKLYFIIQLSYYLHMLPELYFQKVKKDEQGEKLRHSIAGSVVIGILYFLAYRRVAIVLLTLHYFSEFIAHTFGLLEVFDKDEKYVKCKSIFLTYFHADFNNFFLTFSPRLQQHRFPLDSIFHLGSFIPHFLHGHCKIESNAWHVGSSYRLHHSRFPHFPFHHVLLEIKA